MSASILGKASVAAGCFPIASYIIERIVGFRWGESGKNNCFPNVFFYYFVGVFLLVCRNSNNKK